MSRGGRTSCFGAQEVPMEADGGAEDATVRACGTFERRCVAGAHACGGAQQAARVTLTQPAVLTR
jgi:hypothetical protein